MSKLRNPQSASTKQMTMLVEKLGDAKQIRVLKGAPEMETVASCMLVGASAVFGGLLLGPRGIALGGAFGAAAVNTFCQEIVVSLADVMRRMTSNLKEQLAELIKRVIVRHISNFAEYCIDTLLTKILGNNKLLSEIKAVIRSFLLQKMNLMMLQ
ncbi:protein Nazo [Anabrus simplex]|uniref:protein Nazo n=1 Tax=Anabrus simplex TaxID=316456 RepID=UPI0035A2811A